MGLGSKNGNRNISNSIVVSGLAVRQGEEGKGEEKREHGTIYH